MDLQFVDNYINKKLEENENYIRYTFYEVNVKYPQKYGIEKQNIGMFLQLLRTKLKNENYHVYSEGQKFEYNNAKMTVQSNEVLVAVKQ